MKLPDIIEVTRAVIQILEDLNIDYYIGGSLASSAFGIARSTMDVDVVADIKIEHAPILEERLRAEFYADTEMMEGAIKDQSLFNIVHLETMFKIDIFILTDQPFDKTVLSRRQLQIVTEDGTQQLYFSSPEDIILRKLLWHKSGEEISDRQWNDVLGVMKVQGEKLDREYLELWAKRLGIFDLLQKALQEAEIVPR